MKEKSSLYQWGGVYKCPKCRQVSDWYFEVTGKKSNTLTSLFLRSKTEYPFRCGNCRYQEMISLNMAEHLKKYTQQLPHLEKLKTIWGEIKGDLLQQMYLEINRNEFHYDRFIDRMGNQYAKEFPTYSKNELMYACKKYLELYYMTE